MPKREDLKTIMVLGSGPIVIGQAAEFDYAGTQACRSLKEEGIEVCLVNSNPATIMTDKQIADEVYIEPLTVDVLKQIIEKEKSARAQLEPQTVEDIVYRAVGLLKYARKLSSEEMMKLMSRVKLGVSMQILQGIEPAMPLELIIETQPATLQRVYGQMTPQERDACRARVIRERMKTVE